MRTPLKILLFLFITLFSRDIYAEITWINDSITLPPGGASLVPSDNNASFSLTYYLGAIVAGYISCDLDREVAENNITERSDDWGYITPELEVFIPSMLNVGYSLTRWSGFIVNNPTNRKTIVIYCVTHPRGVPASDPAVSTTGIALTVSYVSTPYPTLSVPSSVNLGSCTKGGFFRGDLPVSVYYTGETSATESTISWMFTASSENPEPDSIPALYQGVTELTGLSVSTGTTETSIPDLSLQMPCPETPGYYTWTMNITMNIQ
jgi:hypothetical protein